MIAQRTMQLTVEIQQEVNRRIDDLARRAEMSPEHRQELRGILDDANRRYQEHIEQLTREHEEERRRDIEKLEEMTRQLQAQPPANFNHFNIHFTNIQEMMRNHEGLQQIQTYPFLDSLNHFLSALKALVTNAENITFTDVDQEREFLRVLREEYTTRTLEEIQNVNDKLYYGILNTLPNARIVTDRHLIDQSINAVQYKLDRIKSIVTVISPENWDLDEIEELEGHKTELERSSSNLVELLTQMEQAHKEKLHEKMFYNPHTPAVVTYY